MIVDGAISEVGTYKELLQNEGDFAEFIQTYLNEFQNKEDDSDDSDDDMDDEGVRIINIYMYMYLSI